MCSYASPSEDVPAPRAIARSMLSFGIELSRAFWIAVARVALASGSGPPSRAATMIARESLEKSLPRFASAAPFLCLMLDHLLCPDIRLLPDEGEKALVHPSVVSELRVERGDQEPPLPEQHRIAVELRENLHPFADVGDPGGPDEDAAQGLLLVFEREVSLEARHLASIGVAVDADVHLPDEALAPHEDHSGAGAEHDSRELSQGFFERVEADQPADRGRLAARHDEAVEPLEMLGPAHLDRLHAETRERRDVLAEVPLQGENADPHTLNSRVALEDARGGNVVPAAPSEEERDHDEEKPGRHEHQRAGPLVRRCGLGLLERRLLEREERERQKEEEDVSDR